MKVWHWAGLAVIFVSTVVAQYLSDPAKFPVFYAVFGFAGCLFLLFLAKVVGKKLIMRKEDYYHDD